MEKPITMIINETKRSIADILNQSKLPMFILCDNIMKDLYTEVQQLSRQEVKQEEENYIKSLEEEKENTENKQSAD